MDVTKENKKDDMVLRTAFDKYDKDKSGSIDAEELVQLFTELGWDNSPEDVEKAIKFMDADNSGVIEWNEFSKWSSFAWRYKVLNKRKRSSSFQKCIFQSKGSLAKLSETSLEEMQKKTPPSVSDQMNAIDIKEDHALTMPEADILERAFKKYDTDGNGKIDANEMKCLLSDLGWENSQEVVSVAMEMLDTDHNGSIDYEEFSKWTKFARAYKCL